MTFTHVTTELENEKSIHITPNHNRVPPPPHRHRHQPPHKAGHKCGVMCRYLAVTLYCLPLPTRHHLCLSAMFPPCSHRALALSRRTIAPPFAPHQNSFGYLGFVRFVHMITFCLLFFVIICSSSFYLSFPLVTDSLHVLPTSCT